VPYDWLSGGRKIVLAIWNSDVIIGRNNDVVIVKG
jgi:hypothetical protein